MNNLPKLIIPVGIPGCGKTTFFRTNLSKLPIKYVSRDEIRLSFLKDGEDYFKHEKEVFFRYAKTIADSLKQGENVYADATHLNFPSRAKLVRQLVKFGLMQADYDIVFIYFDLPINVCLQRNNYREGKAKVPEDVITSMFDNMTQPNKEEFTNIIAEWRVTS